MWRHIACGTLAAALATSWVPANAAHGPAPENVAPSVLLEIEVDAAIDDAALVHDWLLGEGRRLLEIHRIDPDRPLPNERRVSVVVAGTAYDYRVQISVREGNATVGPGVEPISCECGVEELITGTLRGIADVLPQLRQGAEHAGADEAETESPPVLEHESAGSPAPVEASEEQARPPLGALGKSGVGLLVGGVVVAGAGIGLVVVGQRTIGNRGELGHEVTDLRVPGYVALGVGAAAVVTGAALLVVDRRRVRRSAFAPYLGPAGAGFVVHHRF